MVSVVRDITDRKREEEEKKKLEAQLQNGYIDVQSTENKRTTFTLYFPATQ
jgi:chemotaxis protein histidine kinase CheA